MGWNVQLFKWWTRQKQDPVVTLLAIDREQVILGSDHPLAVGKSVIVRARRPNGEERELKVLPYYVRPAGRAFVCVGLADHDLGETTRPSEQADWGVRRGIRLRCSLRATSETLPDYQGVILDFTPRGVKLRARGPVEVGTRLELKIETDFSQAAAFECEAEVAWCVTKDRNQALLGLRFCVPQEEMAEHQLQKLEAVLQWREHSSFMESILTNEPLERRKAPREH